MEDSIVSSPNQKRHPSNWTHPEEDEAPEESSWTEILADFSAYNRGERQEDDQEEEESSFVGASMVSDAGSGPEWKQRILSNSNNNNNSGSNIWSPFGLQNMPKKLNFKKKRTQEISYDDSLEDTASSPVNSPKITVNFKRMDINSRNLDDNHDDYMGKGIKVVGHDAGYNHEINEGQEELKDHNHGHVANCKELKNKGLCVVPVSMLLNYLG